MSGMRIPVVVAMLAALACSAGCKGKSPEPVDGPSVGAPAAPDAALPPPPPPAADAAWPSPPPPVADVAEPPPSADAAPLPVDDVPPPPPPASDAGEVVEPPPPATDAAEAAASTGASEPSEGLYATMTGATADLGVVEILLCRAVENRLCMEETRVFAPGEWVWVLLKVTNTSTAQRRLLVSYVAEDETPLAGRGVSLRVPPQPTYTTFAKGSKADPGLYDVVVRDEQETPLARATFEVR